MNVFVYHLSILLDFFLFGAGIVSVMLIKKLYYPISILLNIAKILAGSAIAMIIFFSIPPNAIIGTGLDLALSYIAGVLIASGAMRIETNLI